MAYFVLVCIDKPNALDVRMAAREAHLAYVNTPPSALKLGGPFLSESGEMAGSLMIIDVADMAAARAWHANDPYRLAGLFEKVDIRPWRATVGTPP